MTAVGDPLRCIVVGMGGVSNAMLPILLDKPWLRLVGVVDVRPDALQRAAAALPWARVDTDLGRALDEVAAEAVIVNTPGAWHVAHVRAALLQDRHVLVAKPLTYAYDEAIELVRLAGERGLTLSVAQQLRYNRHYRLVRSVVESGRLGSVEAGFLLNSKPRPVAANLADVAHPALHEMSCHHFDSLLAALGDPAPTAITCQEFNPTWSVYEGPGMLNAMLEIADGLHVLYHGGFCAQAPLYEFRLEGSEGSLRCRGVHMSDDRMTYEFAPAGSDFEPWALDEDVPATNPWVPFLDVWHSYLRGGPEPPFSARNNLGVLAMLDAAVRSSAEGRRVPIAGDPRYGPA